MPAAPDPRTTADPRPWPCEGPELAEAVRRLDAGTDYKAAIEELLLDLSAEGADALQLLLKESRGAWLPFLPAREPGSEAPRALFLGSALSGAVPPLAELGYSVVVCEPDRLRLEFGQHRNEHHVPGSCTHQVLQDPTRLPFGDGLFDVVVLEEGLPAPVRGFAFGLDEVLRVTRDVLAVTADNSLGYKRSTGLRGVYRVPTPLQFLARALRRPDGENTLRGFRRLLGAHFPGVDAYALYPHVRDFTHVVGLDRELPRLSIGPRERKNALKIIGHKLGLFPVLTPSFALFGRRGAAAQQPPVAREVLDGLARELDAPEQELEVCIATRSNTSLWLTRPRDGHAGLCVHLPLSPRKRTLLTKHHEQLRHVRRAHASVPVPEPLFAGEVAGVWLTCEQRLAGMSAPNVTGSRGATARFFLDAARHFADLVVEPLATLDEERFERLVGDRFRLVQRHAGRDETAAAVGRALEGARECLVGERVPLALYHGDLRAKHIQIAGDGRVLGYMDWGASERCFLPYVDLLHMVAHQRKQEEGCSPARTWALVKDRVDLFPHERQALDDYAERVGLSDRVRTAIEAVYPILVAGMAEMNWEYSRPRWLHRCFGV